MPYTYALRHSITKKWYMVTCDNTGEYGWTDDLWLADVYQDQADRDEVVKPYNTEWVALSYPEYAALTAGKPESLIDWLDAIDKAREGYYARYGNPSNPTR